MGHLQVALAGDLLDGPAVAVLDPVGAGDPQPAVVAAGDDGVPDTGGAAVGEHAFPTPWGVGLLVEAVLAGALVEFGDQLAGGGEHDRVEALVGVGTPRGEGVVGHGGQVTDVDALLVQVEAERAGVAVPQGQRGGRFGGVGEPHEFGQLDRAVAGLDVAERSARSDRGELLGVADQPHRRATLDRPRTHLGQAQRVGHPRFVDHQQAVRADLLGPPWEVVVGDGPGEFGEGFGGGAGLLP